MNSYRATGRRGAYPTCTALQIRLAPFQPVMACTAVYCFIWRLRHGRPSRLVSFHALLPNSVAKW